MSKSVGAKSKRLPHEEEYKMDHKYRGLALIFNHFKYNEGTHIEDRNGNDADMEALKAKLPLLGFDTGSIIDCPDFTKNEILNFWDETKLKEYKEILINSDCIAVFILSHGSKDDGIFARDSSYNLYELIEKYTSNNFNVLKSKPKLFFINTCRGEGKDTGILAKTITTQHPTNRTAEVQQQQDGGCPSTYYFSTNTSTQTSSNSYNLDYSDILIYYSSFIGHEAHRHPKTGTWFIQQLCESIKNFENRLDETDITDLLESTNRLIGKLENTINNQFMKQAANYNSALHKKLFFKKNVENNSKPQPDYPIHDLKCIETTQHINTIEYNMNHKHRGVALIFAYTYFSGDLLPELSDTHKDVEALKKTLPLLGFEDENILIEKDLTKIEIQQYRYKIGYEKDDILKNCDCFAVFILSYILTDYKTVMAYDDSYGIYDLVQQYSSGNFKELAGKPKLFFINATKSTQSYDVRAVYSFPKYADMLFSISSHHKQTTNRNVYGSWYIKDLCQSINYFSSHNLLQTQDITDILNYAKVLTSSRDDESRQKTKYISYLNGKLYFNRKT